MVRAAKTGRILDSLILANGFKRNCWDPGLIIQVHLIPCRARKLDADTADEIRRQFQYDFIAAKRKTIADFPVILNDFQRV